MRRLVVGGVSAVTLAGVGVVGLSGPATATSSFSISRLGGIDRFQTAADIALAAFPKGAATVILADGLSQHVSDSLAASYLAGQLNGGAGAPVLLTNPNSLPAVTAAALKTLGAKNVIVVGGSAAVGPAVYSALSGYTVTNVAGPNRFDTSLALDTVPGDMNVGTAGGGTGGKAVTTTNGVTLVSNTVAQGGTVSGILANPSSISSLSVSGAGITSQALTVNATSGAFTFTIPAATAAGADTLVFTATPTNATPATNATAVINITPANGSAVAGQRFAIVADGTDANLVDSLGSAPVAFADHFPILLVNGPTGILSPAQLALLKTDGIANDVLVVGGSAAVGSALYAQLVSNGNTPIDVAGSTRSLTSMALADFAINAFGFSTTTFDIASGDQGHLVDSLSGGPYGGTRSPAAPTLITNTVDDPGAVTSFAAEHAGTETSAVIFGGTSAVDANVEALVTAAGRTAAPLTAGSVSVPSTSVPTGGTLSGTVTTPALVKSVTVSGCGLSSATVTVNPTTGAFSVTLPSTQGTGTCTLTFTSTLANGSTVTSTIGVTVTSPTPTPTPVGSSTGLGTPPTSLVAPVLTGATIVHNNFAAGAASLVEYFFDKPVTPTNKANFKLMPYKTAVNGVSPTSVNSDPNNADAVLAEFGSGVDPTSYTYATVDNQGSGSGDGAVKGTQGAAVGLPNPLGSVPFGSPGSATNPATIGPDLVSAQITGVGPGETQIAYTFDKPVASILNCKLFGYYTSTGAPGTFNATSCTHTAGSATVDVNFATSVSNAVRFVVDDDAVQGNAANVFGKTSGKNPIGSVGASTQPDLASVTPVGTNTPNVYNFTFDNTSPGVVLDPSKYVLFTNQGDDFRGTSAHLLNSNEVQVTFAGPGEVSGQTLTATNTADVVLAAVDEGAFQVTSTASGNTIGAVPITGINLSGGITDGPDLQVATVTTPGSNDVTYQFNQTVATGDFPQVHSKYFFIVGSTGTPHFGTGFVSISGNNITVSFASAADVAAAKGAGVTGLYDAENGVTGAGTGNPNGQPNAPGDVTLSS